MRTVTTIVYSTVFIFASIAFLSLNIFLNRSTIEPIQLLSISIVALILCLSINTTLPLLKSELVLLLFILYMVFRNALSGRIDLDSLSKTASIIPFYVGIKSYFHNNKIQFYSKLLFWNFFFILGFGLLTTIYSSFIKKIIVIDNVFQNSSIFSILLSSQIVFLLPFYKYLETNATKKLPFIFRWSFCIIIFLCILLLLKTNGRAGWIGGFLAILHILYFYQNSPRLKRQLIFFSAFSFVVIFPLLIWFKPGSSSGRLLIYKISAKMFSKNWLWGIGSGQFKVKYNEYQAEYFAAHDIDNKEALLADNTFYAFNDFFQVLIENGIMGLLLLMTLIFYFRLQIKKTVVPPHKKHLFIAAIASFICITTGAFFSYPLQMVPIIVQATLCFALINTFQSGKSNSIYLPEKSRTISKKLLISLSVLLVILFSFYLNFKTKSNLAFELNRTGFKLLAFEKYRDLNNSYFKDGHVFYLYAQELYYRNQLKEASQVLAKARLYCCNNDVYKLSAAIENELQNFEKAEKNYKTAIYMVPNRMISRSNLLYFYVERKDTANAIYWANSIINMPVKVPSLITKNIQQKTKFTLFQLR